MKESEIPESVRKEISKTEKLLGKLLTANMDRIRNADKLRKRFLGNTDKPLSKGDKQTYVSPALRIAVSQKTAYLSESILSSKEFITYESENTELYELTRAYTNIINTLYIPKMNLQRVIPEILQEILIQGCSYARVYWDRKTYEVEYKSEPVLTADENGNLVQIQEEKKQRFIECDKPVIEGIRAENIWFSKGARCIDDASHVAYRTFISYNSLEAMSSKNGGIWDFKNLKYVKNTKIPTREVSSSTGLFSSTFIDSEDFNKTVDSSIFIDIDEKNPLVELIYLHTPYKVQLIANNIPITDEVSLYKHIKYPVQEFVNLPDLCSTMGTSEVDLVSKNLEWYEKLMNMFTSNCDEYLRPLRLISDQADIAFEKDVLNRGPDTVIRVSGDTRAAYTEIRPQMPEPVIADIANQFIQEMKNVMSITPALESQNPGSGIRTTESFEMFQQLGSTRIDVLLRECVSGFKSLGMMFLKLIIQFADRQVIATAAGRYAEYVKVTTLDNFDPALFNIKVNLGSIADPMRVQRINQMLSVLERAYAMDELKIVNVVRGLHEVFSQVVEFEDPSALIDVDPSLIEARQQMSVVLSGKQASTVPGSSAPMKMQAQQAMMGGEGADKMGDVPMQGMERPAEGNTQGFN